MSIRAIDSSLKTRIRGALIFGIVVLGALYAGGFAFILLMSAAFVIGTQEWVRMVRMDKKFYIPLTIFGVAYIGTACGLMTWLRVAAPYGLYNMLTLLLIVWASDISAYFAGRAIGGPKLAPKISPKKTWAGFIGSSVGAGLVAAVLTYTPLLLKFHVDTVGQMTPLGYGLMGFLLAMFGQAGDLFISIFKRRYGVKDTGTLIPGHGGVLDRIDALMLVSIVFGMIVVFFQ